MKKIIITITEEKLSFKAVKLSHFELIGILRYYEKKIWLEMSLADRENKKQINDKENN